MSEMSFQFLFAATCSEWNFFYVFTCFNSKRDLRKLVFLANAHNSVIICYEDTKHFRQLYEIAVSVCVLFKFNSYLIIFFLFPVRGNVDLHSDNESVNDMASVYSNGSYDDDYNQSTDDSIVTTTEKYEEKLLQSIENATEKSAQTRTQSIQTICEILQHRHIPDFVEERKITLMDICEKSLRRGKGAEQEWSARLAPLLTIQLGGEDEIATTLGQILLTTLQNRACAYPVRATSCNALGMMHFLNSDDIGDIVEAMQHFEHIFAGSYLKGDKTPPAVSDDAALLHVAALTSWALLATLIPPGDFCSYINNGSILP